MNNSAVLSRLYDMANNLTGEDKEVYAACRSYGGISPATAAIVYGNSMGRNGLALFEFIHDIENEIREKDYSRGGKTKILAAAKKIIKSAGPCRQDLSGVIEHDGKYMLCDGYRLVVFDEDLPLPRAAESNIGVGLANILSGARNNARAKNIAEECAQVRPYIVEEKAKRKAEKNSTADKRILFDIPGTDIRVNAQYLADMMDALPGCDIYPAAEKERTSPIYFEAENGKGVLLPVNK